MDARPVIQAGDPPIRFGGALVGGIGAGGARWGATGADCASVVLDAIGAERVDRVRAQARGRSPKKSKRKEDPCASFP